MTKSSPKQKLSFTAAIRISLALSLLRYARSLAFLIAPELKENENGIDERQ